MNIVKSLFDSIGRSDLTEDMDNLLDNGLIDSMDIIAFLEAVEKHYKKDFDESYIEVEYFQNFQTIQEMLNRL